MLEQGPKGLQGQQGRQGHQGSRSWILPVPGVPAVPGVPWLFLLLGLLLLGPFPSPAQPAHALEVFQVRFETSQGPFVVEVHREWAPHGADRFHELVAAGYFDGSRFFRVVSGFIAQFGVAGDPKVTAAWKDRTIPDDPVRQSNAQSNTRGTIAYAMTGPHTRATQLYINLADNSRLDAQGFTPIGRVTSGMEVVDRLYSGYGETSGGGMRGGKQGEMLKGGNAWLDAHFPKLDRLLRARIIEEKPEEKP